MPRSFQVDRNKRYVIRSFNNMEIAVRMMAMGVQPGQELRIIGKSPFGKTYFITIGERWVAMRADELEAIDWDEPEAVV